MVLSKALLIIILALVFSPSASAAPGDLLVQFLQDLKPADLNEAADQFGGRHPDIPTVELTAKGEVIGWAFLTSDFVSTIGYSGKPIHTVVAVDMDAVVTGVRPVEHSEPIVLIGIPDSKIRAVTESYMGLDLKIEAVEQGSGHDLEIVSGATVTIIVIDDAIVRGGLKVARALSLGGLSPPKTAGDKREIDPDMTEPRDWAALVGEGAIGQFALDIGQVNQAFAERGDVEAAKRPEKGDLADVFIDMRTALVSVPAIGRSLLGDAEYNNLMQRLVPGEQAILVMGRGRYSFKGSGYVRGGLFDRIQVVQGDTGVRFSDKHHWRLGKIAAAGAPTFTELDVFRIPSDLGFDPIQPWRLQLLVQRAVGPVKKSFLTFDLHTQLPQSYTRLVNPPVIGQAEGEGIDISEQVAKSALWQRIWRERIVDIIGLLIMLGVLTFTFFFQMFVTRSETFVFWFRIAFLSVTLVFLGWYANAQLSIVNLMALGGSVGSGFSWEAFLLDPMVFILWFSVAAALIFWGRGAYCGWLCPFGALQELLNRLAKFARIPQWELPWGLHERLWPIKYMLFLGLFGISLASIPLAETYAEVEPFKTSIILKFDRAWPFVAYAVGLLVIGLFVERFFCRYLCPLGAALAIPARLRIFNWLRRYRECGSPCQRCAQECMVQAIHPIGEINPNECLNCLHCQVLYQHNEKCPVCIKKFKSRQAFIARNKGMKPATQVDTNPA